jgi:hypothetical protein
MNIFTTEHPLDCQSEDKMPGLRSYFFGMLFVVLVLTPFVSVWVWLSDVTGTGDTTPGAYPPLPVWNDVLVAAFISLIIAFVITSLVAIFSWFANRLCKRRSLNYDVAA